MTPQEAIQFLEEVKSVFQANGKDHDNFRLAIEVLRGAIQPPEVIEEPLAEAEKK